MSPMAREDRDAMQALSVDAARYARYAQGDLDRWRQLIGRRAVHRDSRWGTGRVEDVRWATYGDPAAPYVQVRVRYASHGVVAFRGATFHLHHRSVTVSEEVGRVLSVLFDEGRSEPERAEVLERHTRELRAARDREALGRAEALKQRVRRRLQDR